MTAWIRGLMDREIYRPKFHLLLECGGGRKKRRKEEQKGEKKGKKKGKKRRAERRGKEEEKIKEKRGKGKKNKK